MINEKGYEWYVDKEFTNYARKEDIHGNKGLEFAICYFMKKGDFVTRMLVNNETQTPMHQDQTLEGMACFIDMARLALATNKNV